MHVCFSKESVMSEINDFIFFEKNQLISVDFEHGAIKAKRVVPDKLITSKFGKVYLRKGHIMVFDDIGSLNQDGYLRVWCNETLRMKHRLLYWLYTHNLPENMEVDHKDRNRSNNAINNLQLVTRSQNCLGKSKGRTYTHLSKETVHAICSDIAGKEMSITDISKKYNYPRCSVKEIINKVRWKQISDLYF